MPATWIQYGVDALNAGYADPYNPVDAIFAAARYLRAAGAATDLHAAILAYNHSDEYVKSVLLRAKLISSYPKAVIATLTGLTDGRLPVTGKQVAWGSLSTVAVSSATASAVRVRAAGHSASPPARPPPLGPAPHDAGQRPTRTPAGRRDLGQVGQERSAAAAGRSDGRPERQGRRRPGRTHRQARQLAQARQVRDPARRLRRRLHLRRPRQHRPHYPKPKPQTRAAASATALPAVSNAEPKPKLPATAGAHPPVTLKVKRPRRARRSSAATGAPCRRRRNGCRHGQGAPVRPSRQPRRAGVGGERRARRALDERRSCSRCAPARSSPGAPCSAAQRPANARDGHLRFAIRPGGDPSTIDPRPILQNWAQLDAALHPQGVTGDTNLLGATASGVFLMSKDELERTVLSDPGIDIYACGRQDIASGAIDKRVLALLAFLSRSGLKPTVSALRCGHSEYTTSGNVSEHYSGDAVDISAINGIPIAGHQGAGSITDTTIRTLLRLPGQFAPRQIVSLMHYPGLQSTLAMADHGNHIEVGFRPWQPPSRAEPRGRPRRPPTRRGGQDRPRAVVGRAS